MSERVPQEFEIDFAQLGQAIFDDITSLNPVDIAIFNAYKQLPDDLKGSLNFNTYYAFYRNKLTEEIEQGTFEMPFERHQQKQAQQQEPQGQSAPQQEQPQEQPQEQSSAPQEFEEGYTQQ